MITEAQQQKVAQLEEQLGIELDVTQFDKRGTISAAWETASGVCRVIICVRGFIRSTQRHHSSTSSLGYFTPVELTDVFSQDLQLPVS